MKPTDPTKAQVANDEPISSAEPANRTHHHVELVLSRVFAKQHESLKPRHIEPEDVDADGDLH